MTLRPFALLVLAAVSFAALAGFIAPEPVSAAVCSRTTRSADLAWSLSLEPGCGTVPYEDRQGRTIWAVTHDGRGFVGVGIGDAPLGEPAPPVAFRSIDGLTWATSPLPFPAERFVFRARESGVHLAVRASTIGLVGAGVAASSTDGALWAVGTPPAVSSLVTDVAAGSSRWVAVGHAKPANLPFDRGPAAVWSSANGRDWTRIKTYAAFCPEGIAARGARFVAVGSDCGRTPRGVVIMSTDHGAHWTRIRLPAAMGPLHDVVVLGTGLLAAGDSVSASGRPGLGIFHSADGRSWRRVAFYSERRFGEEFVKLAVTSGGVVAIAEQGSLTDALPPTAFFSATGTSRWHRAGELPNPGYGSEDGDLIVDAVGGGRRVVAVGWFNDPDPGSQTAGGEVFTGVLRR